MKASEFFNYFDYRELLVDVIREMPRAGYGQLHKLAQHLSVHSSLLSQIVKGRKDFTLEQALGVARFFQWTERETEYFLTLVQSAKAGTADLRKLFESQAKKIRAEILQVRGRITDDEPISASHMALYYSDWSYIAIWLATTMKGMNAPAAIAAALNLPPQEVERVLEFLVSAKLCSFGANGYTAEVVKTHVPANSPLAKRHHTNWRLKAIERSAKLDASDLMFTAPMTISKATFAALRQEILDLIQKTSETVKKSPCELLVCLNIDLFGVEAAASIRGGDSDTRQ